jgi:hypothetical protein
MRKILLVLLVISVVGSTAVAQGGSSRLEWKDGRIVSNEFKEDIIVSDGPDFDNPGLKTTSVARNDSETITIETDEHIYVVKRVLGVFWNKKIRLSDPVNVKYAIRFAGNRHHHDEFLLQDARGKRISYRILEKTPKQPDAFDTDSSSGKDH